MLVADVVQQLRLHHVRMRLVLGAVAVRVAGLRQHPRRRRCPSLRLWPTQCAKGIFPSHAGIVVVVCAGHAGNILQGNDS